MKTEYNTPMSWQYIAGYGDGEGSMLFGITQDKRPIKTKGSKVDGWNITPSWTITSFDHETLKTIIDFLQEKNIRCAKFYTKPKIRHNNTDRESRLAVFGWDNLPIFINNILPYSIVQKQQLELFLELQHFLKTSNKINGWTKEMFITAMEKVDEINSLKKRMRGKLNANYFKEMWGMNNE